MANIANFPPSLIKDSETPAWLGLKSLKILEDPLKYQNSKSPESLNPPIPKSLYHCIIAYGPVSTPQMVSYGPYGPLWSYVVLYGPIRSLRSSSTEGNLPPQVVFHRGSSSTNHNTLVDLTFVRAVNIPNLSFLPAIHDA